MKDKPLGRVKAASTIRRENRRVLNGYSKAITEKALAKALAGDSMGLLAAANLLIDANQGASNMQKDLLKSLGEIVADFQKRTAAPKPKARKATAQPGTLAKSQPVVLSENEAQLLKLKIAHLKAGT